MSQKEITLDELTERIVSGGAPATIEEAMAVSSHYTTDELADAADKVKQAFHTNRVDTCSIVNARSGRCSEDCKWCAQSRFHSTGCEEYAMMEESQVMAAARANDSAGVRRFSLVTSGRKVSKSDIRRFADIYKRLGEETRLELCASMGLLSLDDLRELYSAGVRRYHCNLETSSRFFPKLCSTHSHAEKLQTIRAARQAGMEVCSGGIIGMGEELEDRLLMAQEVRDAGAVSMPVNLLNPIPGTALEGTPLLSEDEIVRSVALMRMVAPRVVMRFAGGRARLSHAATIRLLRGGINGVLVGDMLTTIGNKLDEDYDLFDSLGLTH